MAIKQKHLVYHLTYIAMCVAFLTVCSWITIPFAINFTMQVFAVFLIAVLSDWKSSLCSVLLYLALGFCGVPVFSGFMAGPMVFVHITGGYLIGFLISAPIISIFAKRVAHKKLLLILVMGIGLLICYTFGVVWYRMIYPDPSLWGAVVVCVLPFLLPDFLKILIVLLVADRIRPHLHATIHSR